MSRREFASLSLLRPTSFCHSKRRVLSLIIAEHLSSPFLDIRPSWTLDGAVVSLPSGDVSLQQLPFLWSAGIWQSDVFACNGDDAAAPRRILLRVATHTLRRWK